MKTLIYCLLISFTLIASPLFGQQSDFSQQRDSLSKAIGSTDGEEKFDAYNRLHTLYMNNLSDEASLDIFLNFSKEYEKYAKQLDNLKLQGDIRVNNLIACMRMHRFAEIEKQAPQTLDFLKKNNMTDGYFVAYKQLILALCSQNRFDEALNNLNAVYEDAQRQDDKKTQFYMEHFLGLVYMYQDRLAEAEQYYRTSIKTAEKMDEKPFSLLQSYLELCNMLGATGQYDDFFEMANQAERLLEQLEKENPNRSYHIDKNNLWILYAYTHKNIGEFDKAEYYCDLIDSLFGRHLVSQINTTYIRAHIKEARKEYAEAIEFIDKTIKLDPNTLHTRFAKIRILSRLENAPLTWAETEFVFAFQDSVRTATFNANLDDLRTRYEVEKHIAEKVRNRNYFLLSLGGCILLNIILGIWIYYSYTIVRKNRGLYSQIKEQDRLNEELKALTKQYEEMAQSSSPDEKQPVAEQFTPLPGNIKQRQVVLHFREYLLKDSRFVAFDIDVQEIAPEIAVSRTSLFEAIKAVTGKTPMEFINNLRLEEAKRLLDNSNLTVETIALDCGFNTSRTFYRQFREKYRITPAEYRKISKTING